MGDSEKRVNDLARQQLDRRLSEVRGSISTLRPPRQGWVKALRTAYGMSQAHLASRMNLSRQAVTQLERRESEGSVTLTALEQTAHALGGELVYAIVPDRPIEDTLEERATRMARQMTGSVRHTMRLEDQEPDSDIDERTRRLAEELLESPRQLWTAPDEE